MSAAGASFAQSSVTIYGVANIGVTSTNGGTAALVGGADGSDSRIGFRGTEDLGGGLQAGFTYEMGIKPDTGNLDNGTVTIPSNTTGLPTTAAATTQQIFQRQAYARLSSASLGEVRFGRQYTLGFDATIASMPSTFTDAGLAVGLGFAGMGSRNSDQIQYRSPSFAGGFAVHGSTQLSGDTTRASTAAAQNTEVRLAYANGPLSANATYAQSKGTNGVSVNPYGLNATYDAGAFKLYGAYIDTARTGGLSASQATTGKGYVIKGYMPVGSNSLYLGYANNTAQDKSAYELGNYYSLSKSTSLYAVYGNGSNDLAGATAIANGRRWALGVHHAF